MNYSFKHYTIVILDVLYTGIFYLKEREIIYNTFILAHFNYWPTVWHFCGKECVPRCRCIKLKVRRIAYLVGLSLTTVKPMLMLQYTKHNKYYIFYTVIGHWGMYINIYRIFKNIYSSDENLIWHAPYSGHKPDMDINTLWHIKH